MERQQRIVLNGQESERMIVKTGMPWGSIAFYIYINNLSDNLEPNVTLFADDTSMFSSVSDPINTSKKLNKDLDKVCNIVGPASRKCASIQTHQNTLKR